MDGKLKRGNLLFCTTPDLSLITEQSLVMSYVQPETWHALAVNYTTTAIANVAF